MFSMEFCRWSSVITPSIELELKVVSWKDGTMFDFPMVCFVPLENEKWVSFWETHCKRQHGVVYPCFYRISHPDIHIVDILERSKLTYSSDEERRNFSESWFRDKGFFVTLDSDDSIVEFRILDMKGWIIEDI